MRLKSFVLIAAALCLVALAGSAFARAKKTAVVVDQKPVLSGTGADKRTLTTNGHLVTAKRCRAGRTVVMDRTDPAGNIQTEGHEGDIAQTLTSATGTWTLSGELKSAPKTEDRILVMVKKKRSPSGRLLCRGARSELLLISG